MKIFKKIAAAVSSAVLAALLGTSVSAEEAAGFDYAPAGDNFVYYDFTAEDGAAGTLTYTEDGDGKLYFSSCKIDSPDPENSEDFPNYTDPDGGYKVFAGDSEFFNYVDELSERDGKNLNYVGIVSKFDVDFDPPSHSVISMSGSKCYIADVEAMTVSYAGYYAEFANIAAEYPENDTFYCECRAEDGQVFVLYFDSVGENYTGYETALDCYDPLPFNYVIDNINGTVTLLDIDTGYELYSDKDGIPLAENEILTAIDFVGRVDVNEDIRCCIKGQSFYVITLNGMNSTVRYMGHSAEYSYQEKVRQETDPNSDFSDGETISPKTGNSGGYFNIMLAAAVMAVLAKYIKK